MELFQCKLCGGDLNQISEEWAKCPYCHTQYRLESLRKEFQIDGVIGQKAMLRNAKTFLDLEQYGKAMELYTQYSDKYPHEPDGWFGTLVVAVKGDYPLQQVMEADQSARIALKIDPSYGERYENIWNEYMQKALSNYGYDEDADSYFERLNSYSRMILSRSKESFVENRFMQQLQDQFYQRYYCC